MLLNFKTTCLVRDCLSWTVRAHVARVIQIEVRYLSKAGGLLTPVRYTKGGVGVSDFSGWSPLVLGKEQDWCSAGGGGRSPRKEERTSLCANRTNLSHNVTKPLSSQSLQPSSGSGRFNLFRDIRFRVGLRVP